MHGEAAPRAGAARPGAGTGDQSRDELADLELVGDNDAAVIAALLGGDGEVELLTVGRLRMSGLVRAERVEPAPSEDPCDDRVDVGVEVDRERQSATAP